MNRKEGDDRSKRSQQQQHVYPPVPFVGNNRQMLQDIRDSLSHVRKAPQPHQPQHQQAQSTNVEASSKAETGMQIKAENGSGGGGGGGNPDARSSGGGGGGGYKSHAYRQKALAEIRNSLLPFANALNSTGSTVSTLSSSTTSGVSSASGLSTASGSSSPCPSSQQNGLDKEGGGGGGHSQRFIVQQLVLRGYDEDMVVKAINRSPVRTLDAVAEILIRAEVPINLGPKTVRRPSLDHDFGVSSRGGSTFDGSTTPSTRSDSPSCASIQMRSGGFMDPPRHMSQSGEAPLHLPINRQYSPSYGGMEPPPPPPPPRLQAPPTPTRGTTPPPNPAAASSQQPFMQPSSSQMHHMLKRISPVPQNQRGYGSSSGAASQSSTPQRGTSPSAMGRMPVVVANSQQIQHQLNQQLQNLSLYNGSSMVLSSAGGQTEPPPPYPIGGGGGKMTSPLPYAVSPQSRQSPTHSSPSPMDYGAAQNSAVSKRPAVVSPFQTVPMSGIASSTSIGMNVVSSRPVALQAWSTRQQPIIMQSVKSTQVQKPVLQTAIAPTAPPPPCYASSIQDSHHGSSSHSGASSPSIVGGGQMPVVPTTDPPSYASSIQALAAQHGIAMPASASASTATTSVCNSSLPAYSLHLHAGLAAAAAAANAADGSQGRASVTSFDSVNTSNSGRSSVVLSYASDNQNFQMIQKRSSQLSQHPALQSKFPALPPKVDQQHLLPCPDPSVGVDHHHHHHQPQPQPPAVLPDPQPLQQPAVPDPSSKGPPPLPPLPAPTTPMPQPHKTTLHSPIPERKSRNRGDDECAETKVKNYSPQAYKFYMEQHMENVFKSRQQRIHRRVQLETEMKKVGLSEEAQLQMRRMLHQKESNYIRLRRAKMEKSMFVKIKTIGVGAFGEVTLVRKIDTNHLYAMKTLRKTDVLKRNQVAHVKAERDILAEADNEWVVKLYYSFQDKENLYFVMDYIPGGDLMSLLIKLGTFDEPLARFYIAELLCAIESVHKMGFIHRDIKPDNILIDREGHIKLTDFGLCTGFRWTHNSKYYQRNGEHGRQDSMDPDESCWTNECRCHDSSAAPTPTGNVLKPLERRRLRREHQRCLAHSLVGTPNYIAPEVLMRTGYTQLCDWWSVGVIMYEMLIGQPPFHANTPAETQFKVIHWESSLRIPKYDNFSAEARDLILKLCTSHDKRLGKNGAAEVRSHPFFDGVDFEEGLRRQRAPYFPTIRYATDTSNFDPVDPEKLRNSDGSDESRSEQGSDGGKHPEHAFFEFTFRRFFDDGGHAYPTRVGGGGGSGGGGGDENDGQSPVYV